MWVPALRPVWTAQFQPIACAVLPPIPNQSSSHSPNCTLDVNSMSESSVINETSQSSYTYSVRIHHSPGSESSSLQGTVNSPKTSCIRFQVHLPLPLPAAFSAASQSHPRNISPSPRSALSFSTIPNVLCNQSVHQSNHSLHAAHAAQSVRRFSDLRYIAYTSTIAFYSLTSNAIYTAVYK